MRILTLIKRKFYLDLTLYSHDWFSRKFVGTRGKNFKTIRSWESKGYKVDPDIFHALCVIFIFCNGTSYFIFVFFLFFFPLDPLGCTLWQPPGTEPQSDYWTICSCSGTYFFLLFLATSDWYSQVSQKLPNASLIFTDLLTVFFPLRLIMLQSSLHFHWYAYHLL